MKIGDYFLAMQSSHTWTQQNDVKEQLRVWVDAPAPSASQTVTISAGARDKQASECAKMNQATSDVQNDPKLQLIILMLERLTGRKVRVFNASQLEIATNTPVPTPNTAQQSSQPAARAGYGVDYSKVVSYSESEQTTMQASGIIRTTDGKEIQFNLNLDMQYQYSETSSTSVRLGDAARKTDPLVINFNGTAAQLTEQRFAFDLNSDGQKEQINAPASGSGFLALDKNGDGQINDGSELFGPGTGNGYTELAKYDSDHNNWIDENDAVFSQLQVWTKDAAGNDKLNSLAALGIGAISLNSIATPFDIKTASNQLLGTVQSSSVVVNEDGTVSSMQQIDLTA